MLDAMVEAKLLVIMKFSKENLQMETYFVWHKQ